MTHIYHDAGLKPVNNEHHYRKLARNQVIEWNCRYGSTECLDDTNAVLDEYLTHNVKAHQDHWETLVSNGARKATVAQSNQLFVKLTTENDSTERLRMITALAFDADAERINLLLERSVDAASIYFRSETERYRALWETVAVSQEHTSLGLDFLLSNLDLVNATYGAGNANAAITRLSLYVVNNARAEQVNYTGFLLANDTNIFFTHCISNSLSDSSVWPQPSRM